MVKKIKSHKDVKLPFGSGKTDTKPWVPRPPVPKAKAHPPGKPGKPNPQPSSPYEPGKSPFKVAKKKSPYSGKGPASV